MTKVAASLAKSASLSTMITHNYQYFLEIITKKEETQWMDNVTKAIKVNSSAWWINLENYNTIRIYQNPIDRGNKDPATLENKL